MARDTREHFRPNFFSVVKCKDEVGAPFLDQNAMRSALPCDASLFAARPQGPDARTAGHSVMLRKRSAGIVGPVHRFLPDLQGHVAPAPRPSQWLRCGFVRR